MTVKIIDNVRKAVIAYNYEQGSMTCVEMATEHGVSVRTIQRVLVEMGVNKVINRKPKVQPVPTLTELHIEMIEPSFMDKLKNKFKALFSRNQQPNAQTHV